MEILCHSSVAYPSTKQIIVGACNGLTGHLLYSRSCSFGSVGLRKSIVAAAKQDNKKKDDKHSFVVKEDEATGPFPEAVLLKESSVQEDGKVVPEFADAEEEELFEFLNIQLQSEVKTDQMRHYEVVYLIHENHVEEVGSVNEKVQDFIREKRGKVWRFSDWGMRRLAYKIQKAKNAHYILMNFEVEAKWINDFKSLLDKDERVIRHLVIKRDEAITAECPPPPEFHTLRADMDDDDDDDEEGSDDAYGEEDDEDWDEEGEAEDGPVVFIDVEDDGSEDGTESPAGQSNRRERELIPEKIGR